MLIEETIQGWLNEKFTEESFRACYVVDLRFQGHKLEIFLDSDDRLDLDMCSQISRWLGHQIETHQLIEHSYTLEVSSAGLDRPLQWPRQYVKNIGRDVQVDLVGGGRKEGKLMEVVDDSILLSSEEIEKLGKKKIKKQIETTILKQDILKTIVKLKF
jgi:ribosome maturation factor RimP